MICSQGSLSGPKATCGIRHRSQPSQCQKGSPTKASSITATLACSSTTVRKRAKPLGGLLLLQETFRLIGSSSLTIQTHRPTRRSTEIASTPTLPCLFWRCCKTEAPPTGSIIWSPPRGFRCAFREETTRPVFSGPLTLSPGTEILRIPMRGSLHSDFVRL